MNIRRSTGSLLKKSTHDSSSQESEKDQAENEADLQLTVAKETCIPLVRGLMALLLSMDFTCNVDLFIVTCKVRHKTMPTTSR